MTNLTDTIEKDMVTTARGGSILMVGRLYNYIMRIAATVVLARILGPEQYGLYNLTITAATVASAVAIFGLDTTVMRYIAIMRSRKDEPGVWGAIQVGLGTSLLLSVIAGTTLFGLAYPIAERIFHNRELAPLLQIISLAVPFLTSSNVLAGATRGFKNMRDTVIAQNFLQPTVRLILIGILALSGIKVWQAVIIYGVAYMTASLLLVYFLNRRFNLRRSLTSAHRETKEVLSFSTPLWLSDMLTTFRANIQTLLIGSLGTIQGVGIFSIANQVTLIGNIFHASLNQSARPHIAELHDQGKRKQLEGIYQTTTRWVVSLNIPFLLLVILFPRQLMSIFGEGYVQGATALMILALVNLVNVATGMCGAILEMSGYNRLKLINSIIRVTLSIVLNFLLIPRYGIVGAAIAALIHELVANGLPLIQIWYLFHILPYNRSFFKPLLAGGLSLLAALLLRIWLPPTDQIFMILLHALVVVGVYLAALQGLGLTTEDRRMVGKLTHRLRLMFSRN